MQGSDLVECVTNEMQIQFAINNTGDGSPCQNVVYVTDDAAYNKVQLQIQLTSGNTTLKPGSIPDPMEPPAQGTTLYLDLSTLQMSKATWSQLAVNDANWTFKVFAESQVLGLTPVKDIPLSSGTSGTVSLAVDGITVNNASSQQAQLYVSYYNVSGVQGVCTAFKVALLAAPTEKRNLSEALTASTTESNIVNSPSALLTAQNTFSLQLASTGGIQAQAGPDTTFTIGFVYGKSSDRYGYGALTDVADALNIVVSAGTNADQWKISFDSSAQSPTWTLQPPAGAPIVGAGSQSVVAFNISDVVTTYQPGPTVMLVSYVNVPGFKDGLFTLVLNKVPHAQIKELLVSPNPACFKDGSAEVTVSWSTSGAQGLTLTQLYQATTVTGKTQVTATLNSISTPFTLTATGISGAADNSDRMTTTATALPVIDSFTASPTEIFSGSQAHDATFAWAVDSPKGVSLTSTGDAFSGQSFPAKSTTTQSITQPQMVTLTPMSESGLATQTRRMVISAFTPESSSTGATGSFTSAAMSPTGPFVLAASGSTLAALDTIQYSQLTSVDTGHPITALTFSNNGAFVASANSDQTVSILSVGMGTDGFPTLAVSAVVTMDSVPQALTFSGDGSRIFATGSGAAKGQPGRVTSLLLSDGSWKIEATVNVGLEPRGLCLDAAGTRVFVANSGDDTVSAIGLTKDGTLGRGTLVQGLDKGPTGIAASPSGQQVLVSCSQAGTVVCFDPDHPNTGQRSTLTVGNTPGALTITPNGGYAFVVNGGDATLSLIGCWGLPSQASVLGKPIQVGSTPVSASISPDGLQVAVATGAGLSMVTLKTYQATTPATGVANHPTNVAALVDNTAVYAWHDASIPGAGSNPGILVYTLASTSLSNVLADKPILRCVCSPNPLAKEAFVIVKGDPSIHVVDTDTLDVTPFELGLDPDTAPVALAISEDGNHVWLITASSTRKLTLMELGRGTARTWEPTGSTPLQIATGFGRFLLRATPDGGTLFLVDVEAAEIRVIQRSGKGYTLSPVVIRGDVHALDLAILPDGCTAYVLNAGRQTNTVTVVDTATLESHTAAIPQSYVNLTGLQPSPDGRRLFATDTNAAALRILDPKSLRILQTVPLADNPKDAAGANGLAVASDGSAVFTANTVTPSIAVVEQIQMGRNTLRAAPGRRGALMTGTDYSGLYMRHNINDTPQSPGSGWSTSPDIIPYGLNIEPDLTKFISTEGYKTDFARQVTIDTGNYVYARGLNTTNAPITSRVYFYYAANNLTLWPCNWSAAQVTVNGQVQNWVDVKAEANSPGVGQIPLLWTAPALPPGADHYCVIGWVDNSSDPHPPDLNSFSNFSTMQDLVNFILDHHNMAWRNTCEVNSPPPDYKYSTPITMLTGGGSILLTVTFNNVPLDGTFAVNLQGTDESNSVSLPKSNLGNYQGGFTPRQGALVFNSSFSTSLQVQHWPGATPLPPNAKINVTLSVQTGPALMRDIDRIYRPRGLRTPVRLWNGIPSMILGSMTYNLTYGAQRLNQSNEVAR